MEGYYPGATVNALTEESSLDQLLNSENSLWPYPPQSIATREGFNAEHTQFPVASDTNAQLSVSAAFHPTNHMHIGTPDLTIRTADGVLFYVHIHILLSISTNSFNSLLLNVVMGATSTLTIPESSSIANILVHAIYGLSCAHFHPSMQDVAAAVNVMEIYGLSVTSLLAAGTPTFSLVLSLAPAHALECYVLAASNRLEDLAVAVSPYTLRIKLSDLTDEIVTRMGPIYLRRLFFLHAGRIEALKRVLHDPPGSHLTTESCDDWEQQSLRDAWTLAIGALVWEPDPALSNGTILSTLMPLGEHLTCLECKDSLLDRLRDALVQWSLVKQTI
ncbi:hypothetical protein K488DRAFT_70146 [Vararia minispora EC-137]|uniref:Uncharacterized protein n=1 Tax=Vararia minispora EC-137 TaxID=1314806 RepID=A0ACB8QN39_9AGAM|nr:hypothetical protein K488DRAFT_70146 [Vararia minispora EC-137]